MRLSLATKIFLGFAVLLATFGLLAFLSVREIRAIAEDLRTLRDSHLALARLAAQLETHRQNRFRDLERGLDGQDPRTQDLMFRISVAYFPEAVRATVEEARKICQARIALAVSLGEPETGEKVRFYQETATRLDRVAEQHELVGELTRTALVRSRAGEPLDDLAIRYEQLFEALKSETHQLNKLIRDETDRAVRRAEDDERNAVWRVVAMTMSALLVGLLLTFVSARAVAPIGRLARYARAISRGDYEQSVELAGQDELASLAEELQQMARSRKDREAALDRQAAELEAAYRRVADLKRYHESIVRSLRTAVVVTDRELRVTSTNRAAETHWGLAPEVRGRPLTELSLGPPLVAELGPLSALVAKAATVNLQAIVLGDLRADVTIAPLLSEHGDVLGLVVALEDVTDAIRTKEALIRSERLAAIGRMSAHVTHEIRNPLSSIGLNAELLADLVKQVRHAGQTQGATADEAFTLSSAIIREVDRLTAITDEYLRFARLPRPELEAEDVGALLSSIAAFVRRDLEAARVTLELRVTDGLPLVPLDADQIRQALLNLVRNAKDSMPQGGAVVLGAELAGDTLVLSVRDTGFGIPAESLERIFDPFFSTKLTGTGLGLALTQQIVTEHGGHLRVTSQVGQGSEFQIVLPVGQVRAEPSRSPEAPRPVPALLDG
ncbi:ATP-binding protein [Myxococcota bacterium]|nr:ATP-binding protein [Myxococcota bacterium]